MAKKKIDPGPPRHFVQAWREARQITQEALAADIDVSHSAISQLETGAVGYSQSMLEAIARRLKVSPAALIGTDPRTARRASEVASDLEKQLTGVLALLVQTDRSPLSWAGPIAAAVLETLRPTQSFPTILDDADPIARVDNPAEIRPRGARS